MEAPDTISPEEVAQSLGRGPASDEAPDILSPEEVQGAFWDSPQGQAAAPDTLSPEEVIASGYDPTNPRGYSGQYSEEVAATLGEDSISAWDAAQSAYKAAGANYARTEGWFGNTINALTIPEQFMARQAVNLIENFDGMSTEEARDLLSRDAVHGSDIVEFAWKTPSSLPGKALHFVAGLAADIILDPLSYVGIGSLTKAAKTTEIAGKTLNLSKVSKGERAAFKTLSEVEKIVKADGSILQNADDVGDIIARNEIAIKSARDNPGVINSIAELEKSLVLSPSAQEIVKKQIQVGMTEKSWLKEWSEGSRNFTLGLRMPFTNAGFEVEMPGTFAQVPQWFAGKADGFLNATEAKLRSFGMVDAGLNLLAGAATKTGKFIYDAAQNFWLGEKSSFQEMAKHLGAESYLLLNKKKKELDPEAFSRLMDDVVESLEMDPLSMAEVGTLSKSVPVENAEQMIKMVTSVRPRDVARAERLAAHPELVDMVSDFRQLQKESMDQYARRGIPMTELNPFGMGDDGEPWARRYLQHMVTTQFLDKMKEVGKADDVIGEALKLFPELTGKVDPSAAGRKFRGTIREANAASLEKFGVKMFVDNPVELVLNRMEEMNKVVRDHDLMEAALPYAIKGKNPGFGYIKYNPDDFSRLTLTSGKESERSFKQFVPEGFKIKEGEALYFPEDVYSRMEFAINGWGLSKPVAKLANAGDFYMNVWRNNALFGAGYIGMNAFSNALQYLSFNDNGGPMALAKATRMLMPWGKGGGGTLRVLDEAGEMSAHTYERIFNEAIQDNVVRSSFQQSMKFGDFAGNVSSTREARKVLGMDMKTVADTAFLWRYSRGAAQFMDDVPKLATYVKHREMGFSRAAAAEASERLFYNFNNVSKQQDFARKIVPFSSFPMKTAEMVYETLKSGKWAGLTIPGKVQAALEGAFVQSKDAQDALNQMLPNYSVNTMHPIHGHLMPGMREVLIDIPWTFKTVNTLFNPQETKHPAMQLLGLAGSLLSDDEEKEALDSAGNERLMHQNLDLFLPSWAREALAIGQIGGAVPGDWFKEKYAPTIPTDAQFQRLQSDRSTADKSPIAMKFINAADFGTAMDNKYGKDWLYNLVFFNRVEDETISGYAEAGERGEYIRQKMRQFTGGLASLNKLDSNFFVNLYAIKKQIQLKEKSISNQITEAGHLFDDQRINEPEFLEKLADEYPDAKELLALQLKKASLVEYYDYFSGLEKKFPGIDPISVMTGADEYRFDYGGLPEKEVYQSLFPAQTEKVLTDEDAEAKVGEIMMKGRLK